MKKTKINCAIIILSGIACIMIVLYIWKFINYQLSDYSSDWGNFGSYIGSITGLLAFIGVLYTIEINIEHHVKDSEQNKFFNLLNLHRDKMYNVEYITNSDNIISIKGPDAFKEYTNLANNAFRILILADIFNDTIVNKPFDKCEILDNLYKKDKKLFETVVLTGRLIHFNQGTTYRYSNIELFNELQNDIIDINGDITKNIAEINEIDGTKILEKQDLEEVLNGIEPYIEQKIWERIQKMDISKLCSLIMSSADYIYNKYGHITGHYFRNMYYVMDTIHGFTTKDNYKNMYRAQLSRYELALGLYNAMSSRSSLQMIELLKDFDIFKDVFKKDVVFIEASCHKLNESGQNQKIKELLDITKAKLQQHLKEKI
jgi:hypothetical protein